MRDGSDTFRALGESEVDTDLDSPDGWVGRIIDGRYRVMEKLAEGGMGSVFVAEHLTLGKLVALKIIHPTLAGDGDFAERFAREAMVSAKLDHPHIASAMDYGRLPEGGAYLVLQLVRGPSVQDVLERKGAIGWPRVCAIGAQVADALAAAHSEGIVHRDLKPENVLLERRDDGAEHVKVLDFGIARVDSSPDGPTTGMRKSTGRPIATRALTRRGMVVGTPGYMSPEQALGEDTDHRTDLYALGVLLYESLTGRALFPQESLSEIVSEQLSGNLVPRLADYALGAPDELQQLIDRMLARQPQDRPNSAAEVRDILRDLTLAAALSGDARARLTPASGSYVVREDTAPVPRVPQAAGQPPAAGKRSIGLLVVATAVLVAVVGGVVYATREPEVSIEDLRVQVQAEHALGELDRWVEVLVSDPSREQRRTAAGYIMAHQPADQTPPWALALAKLEDARGCEAIASALSDLKAIAEPRTHGPIERYQRRTRARRLRRYYRCVQDDLRQTLAAIPAGATVAEDDGSGDDEPGVASDEAVADPEG